MSASNVSTGVDRSWAQSHPGAMGVSLLAGAVVVGVGIKLASPILVPFVLAVLVTTVSAPLVEWLRRHHVPRALAISTAVLADTAVLAGLGALVVVSASQLAANLPEYARLVREVSDRATSWLQALSPTLTLPDLVDLVAVSRFVTSILGEAAGFIWNAVLAIIIATFLLFEVVRQDAPAGEHAPETPMRRAMLEVNKYIAVKTAVSAATGMVIAAWLWLLGADLPVLFGLLAFLLNYIPNIGSFVAATPAIALALLRQDPSVALLVAGGYVGVNVVIGNIVEPRVMGRALGLSPLVVLLSVLVWGVLLGPVGALLSALLTVFVKLALSSTEDLRHLASQLGPTPREPSLPAGDADLVELVVPHTDRGEHDAR